MVPNTLRILVVWGIRDDQRLICHMETFHPKRSVQKISRIMSFDQGYFIENLVYTTSCF